MGQITLQGVQKSFGPVHIIKGADLDIADGSFVVFVGPSGCGKTTLLRLIAGLEDVTGGAILIDGRNVVDVPPAKRGLSMVFQSYALYPHMSVRGNIAFGLKMAGIAKGEINRKVEAAAATLNLTPYLDRKPRELSGGQRQRVAIGRAIVREPKAFLFDEPLGEASEKSTPGSHRGSGGSTRGTWTVGNKGSLPSRKDANPDNDEPVRASVGGGRWRMGP
ncbi:ABC-type sugar transport system ATPase subunit [Bradyrhizobium elkanii]|nr:ABC-type sugar transport system ATPase subunit [Bradyrhizobium elkanii]